MARLLEFTRNHYYLVGLFVAVLAALIVDEALRRLRKFREISPATGVLLINKGAAVLDLRSDAEFAAGHIINAKNIPLADLAARAGELESLRGQPLVLCCKGGEESARAADKLAKQGFADIAVIKGGIAAWQQEHFPLEKR